MDFLDCEFVVLIKLGKFSVIIISSKKIVFSLFFILSVLYFGPLFWPCLQIHLTFSSAVSGLLSFVSEIFISDIIFFISRSSVFLFENF